MLISKKETPMFLRILCVFFVAIAFVSAVLVFISDSWIPSAAMYGSVVVLQLLGAMEKIKYHKEKFTGILFIILALTFCLAFIQTLIHA